MHCLNYHHKLIKSLQKEIDLPRYVFNQKHDIEGIRLTSDATLLIQMNSFLISTIMNILIILMKCCGAFFLDITPSL